MLAVHKPQQNTLKSENDCSQEPRILSTTGNFPNIISQEMKFIAFIEIQTTMHASLWSNLICILRNTKGQQDLLYLRCKGEFNPWWPKCTSNNLAFICINLEGFSANMFAIWMTVSCSGFSMHLIYIWYSLLLKGIQICTRFSEGRTGPAFIPYLSQDGSLWCSESHWLLWGY